MKVKAEVRTDDCSVLSRDHEHVKSRSVNGEETNFIFLLYLGFGRVTGVVILIVTQDL